MKRVLQRTASHCGPAVLEMLVSYLDIKVNQDAFVNAVGVEHKLKHHGMTVSEMGNAARILVPQASFWYKRHATLALVARIIDTYNYPVGVEWQGIFDPIKKKVADKKLVKPKSGDDDDGHYSIITRVNWERKTVTMADPYKKMIRDRVVPHKIFKARWWDLNEITNPVTHKMRHVRDTRMIFIITPKIETFPRDLGLKRVRSSKLQ